MSRQMTAAPSAEAAPKSPDGVSITGAQAHAALVTSPNPVNAHRPSRRAAEKVAQPSRLYAQAGGLCHMAAP
jgi:hypothetical protein